MNNIIQEIFLSDTCGVQKFRQPQDNNYKFLTKKEDDLYEKLKASLSPDLLKVFSEFLDTVISVRAMISEQYYTAGFKTGLRIAAEAYNLSDIFEP